MSVFSQAVNGFRSTVSRGNKFYNSTAAMRGKALSSISANKGKIGLGLGAAAGVGYIAHDSTSSKYDDLRRRALAASR